MDYRAGRLSALASEPCSRCTAAEIRTAIAYSPLPTEALTVPGRAIWRLISFPPSLNEAEALAEFPTQSRSPNREHWIDQLNDPIQGLRL